MTTYTHVGFRAYTGHYAVTADAYRKPGKVHAMNPMEGSATIFVGLCGTRVSIRSDDHFLQDESQVIEARPGHRITCRRCRTAIGKGVGT